MLSTAFEAAGHDLLTRTNKFIDSLLAASQGEAQLGGLKTDPKVRCIVTRYFLARLGYVDSPRIPAPIQARAIKDASAALATAGNRGKKTELNTSG